MLQSTQFIKNTAQGPYIRLVTIRRVLTDLWGHVIRRAYNSLGIFLGTFQHFTDTEVAYFHYTIRAEKNVACLYVPMQNLLLVYIVKGKGDLQKPVEYKVFAEMLFFCPHAFYMKCLVPLFAVLHDYNKGKVFDKGLYVLDYMRVFKVF